MTTSRRPSPFDVRTQLLDFAIVTFAVEPATLQALLAPGFEAEVFTLADGTQRSLISAVPFRDADFTMRVAPWLHLAMGQINYRAYVLYRGERAVWFLGTMLASPFVAVPRDVWRLPWHGARISIDAAWDGERCTSYALDGTSAWGTARFRCEGTAEPIGTLDGFTDAEQTRLVLTHPLLGYYYRRDRIVGTYSVYHERLTPLRGLATEARFTVFEDAGLIDASTKPHSVLLQRATTFDIDLPPTLA